MGTGNPQFRQYGFLIELLDRANKRVRSEVAQRLDWSDKEILRPWHMPLLFALPAEGAKPSALADHMGISRQAVSEWIRELSAEGYLTVEASADDGRVRIVRPAAKGIRAMEEATQAIRAVEAAWAKALGAERIEALRATLGELRLDLSDDSRVEQSPIRGAGETSGSQ